ncbi:MAG: metal-dependent hydrolase [Pirellula sp.]|nr:metal-dependent hydrolase [Pirellula sp.]
MKWNLMGTWYGHSTWGFELDSFRIVVDPFLDANPSAKTKASEIHATHVLISHGHSDHIADAASIARRTGAQVLTNFEIAQWLERHHQVPHVVGMNHGGKIKTGFGSATLVPAVHSSSLPDGTYGGTAGGWLLEFQRPDGEAFRIYYAGDTAVFSDMKWIARNGIDCFIVPIGDLFTMGPEDSLEAIRLVAPRMVIPTHYNTWPPIAQDARAWAEAVKSMTSAIPLLPDIDVPFSLLANSQ